MQGFYFRLCPYGEARTCNGTTTRTRNNIGRVQKALQQNSVVVSFSAPDKPLKCRICKKFGEIQLIHWTEFYWQHWLLYDYSWCVLRAAYCFNHSSHPNRYLACVFVSKQNSTIYNLSQSLMLEYNLFVSKQSCLYHMAMGGLLCSNTSACYASRKPSLSIFNEAKRNFLQYFPLHTGRLTRDCSYKPPHCS